MKEIICDVIRVGIVEDNYIQRCEASRDTMSKAEKNLLYRGLYTMFSTTRTFNYFYIDNFRFFFVFDSIQLTFKENIRKRNAKVKLIRIISLLVDNF